MFYGLFQSLYERRIVKAHDRHWVIVHAISSTTDEIRAGIKRRLALAVQSDESGQVILPATAMLIEFEDA